MTRETKIGLLVGLAFIIVIGILLSDHMTTSTEPQSARLTDGPDKVRQGVATPGSTSNAIVAVTTPEGVTPQQPVPTREELTPRAAPVQIVRVGPGPGSDTPTRVIGRQTPATAGGTIAGSVTGAQTGTQEPVAGADPPAVGSAALRQAAKAHGEELVAAGTKAAGNGGAGEVGTSYQQYKAESGDTVSKMAVKFFGANTKTNRDAIVKANPSLQQDANKVVVGKAYNIPAVGAAAAQVTPAAPVVAEATEATVPVKAAAPAAGSPEYFYTVQPNDSLWKIASEQLDDPGTIAAIKALNRDVLKDADVVRPGMKLRLPAKPVASAN